MTTSLKSFLPDRTFRKKFLAALFILLLPATVTAQQGAPVTVKENPEWFILDNGIITAHILKADGDIRWLQYHGTEILTDQSGHPGGHWSHDTTGGADLVTAITIDPADNGGERAEVSVKGISGGIKMGHGPGAAEDGDFPADIDIRYTLERGASGIYTYSIFHHRPEYPAATMTEARFAAKLADYFDWLHADELRNKYYPEELPGEDKYVYTTIQFENPAFGFSSSTENIGFFFVNPSVEYLSGGPTKPEFLVHRDTSRVQAPVILNYWRSSHYGGANVTVAEGEDWTKVIGPFLLYVNEGPDPQAMWRDARERATSEADKWPYTWVNTPGYAPPATRSSVSGRLRLDDPDLASFPGRLLVGLAQPTYTAEFEGRESEINWQRDARHYQFWVESHDPEGHFTIPKVSPGTYTLYALADGVLGEFAMANITVGEADNIDLGSLHWAPVRHGSTLWEVGIPDRSGREFAGGERFFEPDITLQYPAMFPDDVNYIIGESDYSTDWFFAHVPRNTDPDAQVSPFRGVTGSGPKTPRHIHFALDAGLTGEAVLRLAITGTGGVRTLDVEVNGQSVGTVNLGMNDGVITRHQAQGLWYEREVRFDASVMRAGNNTLTLTLPAGNVNDGVVYDYLRLELADSE